VIGYSIHFGAQRGARVVVKAGVTGEKPTFNQLKAASKRDEAEHQHQELRDSISEDQQNRESPISNLIQESNRKDMEKNSESDLKLLHDMFKSMFENLEKKMSENIQKNMSEMKESSQNLERGMLETNKKISETNQEIVAIKNQFRDFDSDFEFKVEQIIDNVTRVINEKISSEVTRVEVKLNEKFEQLAEEMEEQVKNMTQKVQVEDEKCTEEILKRQGEKAAQLKSKSKDLQNESHEGPNQSQVREVAPVQNESSGFQISLTQAGQKSAQLNIKNRELQSNLDEGLDKSQEIESILILNKSRNVHISFTQAYHGVINENILNCKSIYLFENYGYAYNSRTVRIDITVYEKDRIISHNKVTKYKKCKRLEWCINVKEKDVSTSNLKEIM
jgi:hypothetical protein